MSTLRGIRRFAIGFFAIQTLAVIYPAVAPFRGPRPFVLGMPLAMMWTAAWVVAAFFVLVFLDRAYSAAERRHDDAGVADERGAARAGELGAERAGGSDAQRAGERGAEGTAGRAKEPGGEAHATDREPL